MQATRNDRFVNAKRKMLFGTVYTAGYVFLGVLNIGAEPVGTVVFLAPIIPWPVLLICIAIVDKVGDLRKAIVFGGLMTIFYCLSLLFLYSFSGGGDLMRSTVLARLEREPLVILGTLGWFIAGQVIVWLAFVRGLLNGSSADTHIL